MMLCGIEKGVDGRYGMERDGMGWDEMGGY